MALSGKILESAQRVLDYHRASRLDEASPHIEPQIAQRPPTGHLFDFADKTPLSTHLLDVSSPVLTLLEQGVESVPDSLHCPPQDLRTLSTWLHLAAGQRKRVQMPWGPAMLRAVPSCDMAYPGEIYVAAFSVEGLAPGLHHYSVKEHALRQLRNGPETLALLRRGRPDLNFLSTVPAALLVSSVYCRSSWLQGKRGYRQAVMDTGHLVASLHAVAMGLGINTVTRLRMMESSMRDLIGIAPDVEYAHAESVQAMLVWADGATRKADFSESVDLQQLMRIPRPSMENVVGYGSVIAVHSEVNATGIAIREVKPPLTDLTPMPTEFAMTRLPLANNLASGRSLRLTTLDPQWIETFHPRPVSRDLMIRFARCAFRGGTFFPLKPQGAHTALVRPFWVMQDVTGQEPGIWWYDPVIDKWAHLNRGQYKHETGVFTRNRRQVMKDASAICVIVANLKKLLTDAGPDLYRLALLEAGIASQRLNLAATSVGWGCRIFGDFHDADWKTFLGLGATGWEPLAVCAIGGLASGISKTASESEDLQDSLAFRD